MVLIVGLTIAFVSCWQVTLVSLAVFPVLLAAGKLQVHFTQGFSNETDEAYKECHKQVIEALLNYRTVISFNLQEKIMARYDELLAEPLKIAFKRGNITGISFGLAQALISCIFVLIFYIGALFIRDQNASVEGVYTAIYAIMFAAMSAGGNLGFVGGITDSRVALTNVMAIMDNNDETELYDLGSLQPVQGDVEFRNVTFSYPLRTQPVLSNVSFRISKGSKVGLVGASGCGKSTIVALLLRLYNPSSGQIYIDGRPIEGLDLQNLRLSYGVVSQEPVLFNRTVYENIKYNQETLSF